MPSLPEFDQYSFAMTVFYLFFREYPWEDQKVLMKQYPSFSKAMRITFLRVTRYPKILNPSFSRHCIQTSVSGMVLPRVFASDQYVKTISIF